VPIVTEARDLPQPQFPLEEPNGLIVQTVLNLAAIDLGASGDEAVDASAAALALAVGEDIEVGSQQLLEKLGAPAAPIEHDGGSTVPYQLAHLGQDFGQHLDRAGVGRRGHHE
jgi:hypothetical protein